MTMQINPNVAFKGNDDNSHPIRNTIGGAVVGGAIGAAASYIPQARGGVVNDNLATPQDILDLKTKSAAKGDAGFKSGAEKRTAKEALGKLETSTAKIEEVAKAAEDSVEGKALAAKVTTAQKALDDAPKDAMNALKKGVEDANNAIKEHVKAELDKSTPLKEALIKELTEAKTILSEGTKPLGKFAGIGAVALAVVALGHHFLFGKSSEEPAAAALQPQSDVPVEGQSS